MQAFRSNRMDYSVTFARHFSRLVWLLLHEVENVREQKAALRALVTVSKEGAVRIAPASWQLTVNGEHLPEALTGVQELTAQMVGHALVELLIDANAAAADILGAARLLATEPIPGDGGRTFAAKLVDASVRSAHVIVAGLDAVRPRSPAPAHEGTGVAPPGRPSGSVPVVPSTPDPGVRPARPTPGLGTQVVEGSDSGRYLAFAALQAPSGTPSELLAKLDSTQSVAIATRLLDELVTLVENAARDAKPEVVGSAFSGIVTREARLDEGDLRRAYVMAIRRLSKPTVLRAVATLLTRHRHQVDEYVTVLSRTSEEGADALIEQLTAAQSLADRRVYFDALVRLNAGVPALIHMLGDARWYVARNAADLLGEIVVPEAERPLCEAATHDDDRVRRAVVTALAKLGTPRAHTALREALRDSSPQVRMQAAVGLGLRKGQKSASTLSQALDEETDSEVQLQIAAALGRLGTPDAIQRLIKLAEPEGRLFKKKSPELRVAAVIALGDARSPSALNALQGLLQDKEKTVREAVVRVVMAGRKGG
ncbi:MAG: hypothetical protein NVS4B3_10330 [Gemmatimonadaceae bacterium]